MSTQLKQFDPSTCLFPSFLCCKSIYPEAETSNKYRICVRSTIILMIVMIIKRYSMRSFKDNYSGISAQFKKLEAV